MDGPKGQEDDLGGLEGDQLRPGGHLPGSSGAILIWCQCLRFIWCQRLRRLHGGAGEDARAGTGDQRRGQEGRARGLRIGYGENE